eukprot:75872-Pyramimonas_sp.AAC.1
MWSRSADGSYRAKARLVIQGFRDPDAIAGELSKSSPTMARLRRTFIVMLGRIHGWTLLTADVSAAFLPGKRSDRGIFVLLLAEACR